MTENISLQELTKFATPEYKTGILLSEYIILLFLGSEFLNYPLPIHFLVSNLNFADQKC